MSTDYNVPRVTEPGSTPIPDWRRATYYRIVTEKGHLLHGPHPDRARLVADVERDAPGAAYTVEEMWIVEAIEWRVDETPADREQALVYAFGHLVASYSTDAHSADSGDEGQRVLDSLGIDAKAKAAIHHLAEHVAGDYTYNEEKN